MQDKPSQNGTISQLIDGLKRGDATAAEAIWNRFYSRLVAVAQKGLAGVSRRVRDEEDVALSVLDVICRGAQAGRFPHLTNRDDLWQLLLSITRQKIVDNFRHETRLKRGEGRVRGESVFLDGNGQENLSGLDGIAADEPTPEFLAALTEEYARLIRMLQDETLRRIAAAAMEGYTTTELAAEFGVSIRTIQRKLRLIQTKWSRASQ